MSEETHTENSISLRLRIIAYNLGISIEDLKNLDDNKIEELVVKRKGTLKHTVNIGGLIPRGNPLLGLGKFLDSEKVTKRFNEIFS